MMMADSGEGEFYLLTYLHHRATDGRGDAGMRACVWVCVYAGFTSQGPLGAYSGLVAVRSLSQGRSVSQ